MRDKSWQEIVWLIIKILFWLIVGFALLRVVGAMLGALGRCLEESPWVNWVLGTAFWVGIIWYNIKKDKNKKG